MVFPLIAGAVSTVGTASSTIGAASSILGVGQSLIGQVSGIFGGGSGKKPPRVRAYRTYDKTPPQWVGQIWTKERGTERRPQSAVDSWFSSIAGRLPTWAEMVFFINEPELSATQANYIKTYMQTGGAPTGQNSSLWGERTIKPTINGISQTSGIGIGQVLQTINPMFIYMAIGFLLLFFIIKK